MERKMYGPELVFKIINFECNHVLKLFDKNMSKNGKMQFSQKIPYSKNNKAIDVIFAFKKSQLKVTLHKYAVKWNYMYDLKSLLKFTVLFSFWTKYRIRI